MNNKDFITELAQRTGYSADETQQFVNCVVEAMGDHFQDDDSVLIPTFGTFEVKKKMERIMVKISIQELANVLIERKKMNRRDASLFVSAMFDIVQQHLETDKLVKVKGLGTFKIIDVEDRESVNVNTGERVLIEGHGKITYAPDALLKELVNKPFSQFETVVLNDGVDFEDVDTTTTDLLSPNQ